MAQDLTGYSLSDVYQTFLHTDTRELSSGPLKIYNGLGQQTSLSLSTSSAVVTGSLIVNDVKYPTLSGAINSLPVMSSSNQLEFRTLNYLLTSLQANPIGNGTYSSATLTFVDGLVSSAVNTGTTKLFFMPSRAPGTSDGGLTNLISYITWTLPTVGDVAFVLQKVMNGATMVDLAVYRFVYNTSNQWELKNTY
jgi:hypothetical protein